MKNKKLPVLALIFVLLSSCDRGKETIPQQTIASIYYFTDAASATTAQRAITSTNAVIWNSATIFVDKIAFSGTSSRQVDTLISVQKKVDLLAPNPLAGIISLPSGLYKNVRVRLLLRKSLNSDLTFELKGTFLNTKGIQTTLGVYNSDFFDVNLATTDMVLNPSVNHKAIFSFDLTKVLNGISIQELENAHKDPQKENFVYISSSVSIDLYDRIKTNWQSLASVKSGN